MITTTQNSAKTGRPAMSDLDLRDYFAANATESDVAYWQAHYVIESTGKRGTYTGAMAPKAPTREQAKFAYADAMLAARKAMP